MNYFTFRENELYCEEVPLREVGEEFGTPLYVYSKNQILENYRAIDSAFGDTNHVTCYALKANSNLQILKLLAEEGAGADVVSQGELYLARKAGFPAEKITYAGAGKRDDEIAYAIRQSILSLIIESEEELRVASDIAQQVGRTASISLRVNPNIDSDTHPYITTGSRVNKFGIDHEHIQEAFKLARSLPNLRVIGIHVHIGSQITRVEPFVQAATTLANLAQALRSDGVELTYVDVGGGVGVDYDRPIAHDLLPDEAPQSEPAPAPSDVVQAIVPILQPTGCTVIFEPGRTVVANAGVLVTKVLYTKQLGGKKFIVVDAGMNDLIRPSLYNAHHQIVPLKLGEGKTERADLVGPICESGDFFALDRSLPVAIRGELLAIATAGAYAFSASSNYNGRLRPAEMLVNGEKCRIIRERETLEDLL